MNRFATFAILLALVGCASNPFSSSQPSDPKDKTKQLIVEVDATGKLHSEGWNVTETELPDLVKERQPTSAVVRGLPGSEFGKALQIQAELKAAGVSDVTIEKASGE
jgi:biopolymer transport protein ExbD